MTAKELIDRLSQLDEDKVVIIQNNIGWSNLDFVREHPGTIDIIPEDDTVFSEH